MDISNEKRREVARKLRIQLQYMRKNKEYENDNDIVKCGNLTYRNIAWSVEPFGNLEPGNYIHIVDHLAELIEPPTCLVQEDEVEIKSMDGTVRRVYTGTRCSNCGNSPWADRDSVTPFCPECGAEVIE